MNLNLLSAVKQFRFMHEVIKEEQVEGEVVSIEKIGPAFNPYTGGHYADITIRLPDGSTFIETRRYGPELRIKPRDKMQVTIKTLRNGEIKRKTI